MAGTQPAAATVRKPWQQRRSELLDTAEQLFFERGFSAVSLADIAEAAGVTKPIAYRHFQTREGAYLACARRAQADYVQTLQARLDSRAPVRQQLADAADVFFGLLETRPERWELVYGSAAVLPVETRDELAAVRVQTITTNCGLIMAAQPNAPKLLAEALAHALSGAAERLGLWWKTRPDIDRGQLIALYVEIFYAGIVSYTDGGSPSIVGR